MGGCVFISANDMSFFRQLLLLFFSPPCKFISYFISTRLSFMFGHVVCVEEDLVNKCFLLNCTKLPYTCALYVW